MDRRWNRSAGMGGTGTVALKSSPVLDTAMFFLRVFKVECGGHRGKLYGLFLASIHPRLDVWDSSDQARKPVY